MKIESIFAKILGFIVIIMALALGPTIYTTNALIVAWGANSTTVNATHVSFIGLETIAGFGAFLIIFGLLVSGGMMAIAGKGGGSGSIGRGDMLAVVLSVVSIVLMLTLLEAAFTYLNNLLIAATAASDTIGTVGFGIIPILIYIGIIGAAGWTQVRTIKKMRRGRRRSLGGYV